MEAEISLVNTKNIGGILFESAAEALVVVDKHGLIQLINPQVTEMFGYKADELTGKPVEVLIPQQYRKAHVAHREEYGKQPSRRSMGLGMDLSAVRKDGSTFPVEISLNHFLLDDKMMVMALISDITERSKAEESVRRLNAELEQRVIERTRAMEESQQLYKMISRNYPNGMISVFDRDLNYVFAEGMELYKMGITSDELKGTNYLNRLPENIRDNIKRKLIAVFEGRDSSFEIEVNNGKYMINAVGLLNAEGVINQILVVQQNITRLKQAEEDIRDALEKEKHLNELKSRFVSMASHEFRTPLTTVMSSLTLLTKYLDNPANKQKQDKQINRIRSSVYHLTNMLNDFLSLDKLEDGNIELRPVEFDLAEFSREFADEMQEMAKPGQQIKYSHKGETVVFADKQMLKNILNNLLSNAIKYSAEDRPIELQTRIEKKVLEVIVKDRGIGIPMEEQTHMFDRFFRARNALNIQGTGLGLNIVQKYLDMAGGKISFKSDVDVGTTFIVSLPVGVNTDK